MSRYGTLWHGANDSVRAANKSQKGEQVGIANETASRRLVATFHWERERGIRHAHVDSLSVPQSLSHHRNDVE